MDYNDIEFIFKNVFMSQVWSIIIIISIGYGILTGNTTNMAEALLKTPNNVLDLVITLTTMSCFWNGFLHIASHVGILSFLQKRLQPILQLVFKEVADDQEVCGYIASNFIANLFGLGAIASFSAIQAYKRLDILNNHQETASHSMILLFVINCIGVCILPTNLISLRLQYQSANPGQFVLFSVLIGTLSTIIIIIIDRIWWKYER